LLLQGYGYWIGSGEPSSAEEKLPRKKVSCLMHSTMSPPALGFDLLLAIYKTDGSPHAHVGVTDDIG
jgi:hypothetical protein